MIHNYPDFLEAITQKASHAIIALDLGQKKIGVAYGIIDLSISLPLTTLMANSFKDKESLISEIIYICHMKQAIGIIIGLPLMPDGSEGPQVKRIKHFAHLISQRTLIPILLQDESYSTYEADALLRARGLNTAARDNVDDQVAAQIILNDFFQRASLPPSA